MSWLARSVGVIAMAGAIAASASAAESTIYPGVGIGKVKLGMTRSQVVRALGKDSIVNDRTTIGRTRYVELAWNYATWTVTFAQHGRALTAVQVATDLLDQHTAGGIGMGSKWRAVLRVYPGGRCG